MYRLITFFALLALGLVVFLAPGLTSDVAGYKPLNSLGPEQIDPDAAGGGPTLTPGRT